MDLAELQFFPYILPGGIFMAPKEEVIKSGVETEAGAL